MDDERADKALLGPFNASKSELRRPSYTPTHHSRRSLQSDPMFQKATGGVGQLMDEIGEQSEYGLRNFYPEYCIHEQSLAETLDALAAQAAHLAELRASGVETLARFDSLAEASHDTFDRSRERFRQWRAPEREIEHFQRRIAALQTVLADSRAKLQRVSEQVALLEGERNSRSLRMVSISCVVGGLLALVFAIRWLR